MNEDQRHERELEFRRLLHDYIKHLATLSTGSILLIITFREKLSDRPHWTWMVAIAMACFAISLLASVIAQISSLDTLSFEQSPKELEDATGWSMILCWLAFLLGIAFFVTFGIRNIL
jgi:hypothetical protein